MVKKASAPPLPSEAPIRRIAIIGVSGYLGSSLAIGLRDHFEVFGSYNTHPLRIEGVTCFPMNCVNGGEILEILQYHKPEGVIYCAGISDPAICQASPPLADSIHFKAPTVFLKILPTVLRFLYLSTDEVYGGHTTSPPTTPYVENPSPAAQSVLAKTRLHGEQMALGHRKFTAVMRLGEVFGDPFGLRMFHSTEDRAGLHWFDRLQENLFRGERMSLYQDQIRNYLYVGDLVRAVRRYFAKPPLASVLYNLGAPNAISQYEFGRQTARALGYDEALIQPTSITRTSAGLAAGDLRMTSDKFANDHGFRAQTTEEALGEYAERLRTGHTRNWV
jgi:dTDP-4-dehydrorhamnose reductase